MVARVLHGAILSPRGFVDGELSISADGHIAGIAGEAMPLEAVRYAGLPIVLPGFIDTHVHGGGGRDTMEGGDAVAAIARIHAQHGTTSMLATTMTAPTADLDMAFGGLREALASSASASGQVGRIPNAARLLGVHLEGPYINAAMLGAQPDFARSLDMAELQRLHAVAPIRLITLAPEVPGNLAFIRALVAAGFVVQLGHSAATFEEGRAALNEGASGFTHLFNAMTGMHHRKPGLVGAALAHGEYAEIIPDLLHVHEGAIRVALRAVPKLFCVTDSTAAAGMPDGEYRLGRHTVTKCLGGVRLPDGTLAGSTLTMDQALRNLVDTLGLDLQDASRRVSTNAADYLGVQDRGRLTAGAWADVVVLDAALQLTQVYVEGEAIERN
jgi:N-acetylglucosamine-6-phosphate deacetylase